ncbi:MAG: glycosyltransferase family 4 protein [candidate division WOR-3 bacterium]|nr:MAG: glycosyltransferase family 4 protein [candidate division WOR-3 bacterium]
MKVAIIAYGHADNVLCLSNNLSRYVDVTLIFVMSGNHFTRSIFDWDISRLSYGLTTDSEVVRGYLGNKLSTYISDKLKVFLARTPSLSLLREGAYGNLRYVREIAQYVRRAGFEVVHFNGSSGFQLYFQHYLRHLPKALTIHDYLPHSGEGTARRNLVNTLLNSIYSRSRYQFIQHYHFLSKRFAEFYGVHPQRVNTVYCGPLEIYRVFAHRDVKEDPNTILFFGRISKYKGLDYLVEAARIVRKSIKDTRIIVAGKGEIWFKIERDDRLFEIRNYHISNEELVDLIQRAALVVAPYTDATHSAVVMTSYAFCKPVVASSVSGIPEVVKDGITGRLVPPRDSKALAHALTELLQDRQKRDIMKRNIARFSNDGDISWDNISRATIAVYERAINSRGL